MPTRRHFMQTALATGLSANLASRALARGEPEPKAEPKPGPAKKLRILILGGTGFLGPAIVEQALKDGHTLTLFNRGKREKVKGTFFEHAEHLYGNRDPKLRADQDDDKSPLGLSEIEDSIKAGKKWDAVIDTSGYFPRMVKASAELLAPAVAQYLFISTVSVYSHNDIEGEDESAALATIDDPTVETMGPQFQNYGPLKALCEDAVSAAFKDRATIVRPGYIVGVRDDTDRFTYWPVRTSEGGEMIAPGKPADPVQYIDVRDLAAFILRCLTTPARGTFNATSTPMPWGDILAACAQATKNIKKEPATQVWIPNDWLAQNGLEEGAFPIYIPPHGEYAGFHKRSVAKAVAAGLTIRPTAETCTEILNWWPGELQRRIRVTQEMKDDAKKAGKPKPKMADPTQLRAGPPKDKTDELLKKWHEHAATETDHK